MGFEMHSKTGTSTPDADTLSSLLTKRSSCRAFRTEAVPDEVMTRLFAMAQRTPSWCNVQPWRVTVTTGAATRRFAAALSRDVPNGSRPDHEFPVYEDVYADRRRVVGYGLYSSLGIEREDREARSRQAMLNYSFFGAPHTAVIATPKRLGVYGAIDCGAYVSTLLLAAESLGLAAIAQGSLATQSPFVRSYFDLPDDLDILCGVSFGYADVEHRANSYRAPRAALAESVRFVRE